jgi:serine protease inhibitor
MNYICESEKHKYSKGYLYLPINLNVEKLPENITIQDTQLQIKSSFHVSLICIKNIEQDSGTENIGEKIINLFCEFIKENDINFDGFTGEFRFAKREEDDRRSLVGMCNISNLNNFFDKINSDLGLNIPYQPTHVSLYTLVPDEAIGLNSLEDILSMTIDISHELPKDLVLETTKI